MSHQRVVLVSGANKGIGLEAVKLLSAQHPNDLILLGSRDIKNGEEAINQSITANNPMSNVKVVQLDVTSEESVRALAKHVEAEYGRLDVLINNSGIAGTDEPDVARSIFAVNLSGVQSMNAAFLPLLLQSNNPYIITVSSELGTLFPQAAAAEQLKKLILSPENLTAETTKMLAEDYLTSLDPSAKTHHSWKVNAPVMYQSYSISKTLVSGYSRWLALQHPEIRQAVVCPGYCNTALTYHQGPRPAVMGAQSVLWPLSNEFKQGEFYQDGKQIPFDVQTTF